MRKGKKQDKTLKRNSILAFVLLKAETEAKTSIRVGYILEYIS